VREVSERAYPDGARGEAAGKKERKHESTISGAAFDLKTLMPFFRESGNYPLF